MLQKLLADRFQLVVHRDRQEMLAYVLSIPKGGSSKLHESHADSEGDGGGAALINLRKSDIAQFAQALSGALRSPVIDMMGLKGRYDFKLDIAPYVEKGSDGGVDDAKLDIQAFLPKRSGNNSGLSGSTGRPPPLPGRLAAG